MADKKGTRQVYPKENETKLKAQVRSLKAEIRSLKRTIRDKNADIRQLEEALEKNFEEIARLMGDKTLEDVIAESKKPKKKVVKKETKEDVRKRFAKLYSKKEE